MTPTHALGWTLVHTLWQGALVASAVAIVLSFVPRAAPQVRYTVSVVGLVLMAAAALLTGAGEMRRVAQARDGSVGATADATVSADRVLIVSRGTLREVASASAVADAREKAGFGAEARAWIGQWERRLEPALPSVVVLWFSGVLLLSARLVGGFARLRDLTRTGTSVPADAVERVQRVATRMGMRRPVRVLVSLRVDSPAILGWIRPVLLMPVSALTGLPPHQLEGLIAHELAHVRRHDYAVNLFQTVVETLLFFHPAVWWISSQIRQEREHCCDDLAVAVSGDARLYARTLLELETRRAASRLAVAAAGGSLTQRILRLVAPAETRENGARWAAGVFALLAVGAAFASAQASHSTPRGRVPQESAELAGASVGQAAQDTARARPARVVRYDGTATLAARADWARTQARAAGDRRYWLGYVVQRDDDGVWHYFDRNVPLRSGDSFLMGRIRMSGPDRQLRLQGADLGSLVGQRAPHSIAVIFGFEGNRLVRTHLSSYVFPVHFAGWPLYWAGDAESAQSVALIEDLFASAEAGSQQEDLVDMVSAHGAAPGVLPALLRWTATNQATNVRVTAVEGLGELPEPRALSALARIARTDANAEVRREAAESAGDVPLEAAADTVIALARELEDTAARQEAVEALGTRSDPRIRAALARIARDDENLEVRLEAVETLGDLKDNAGLPELLALVRDDVDTTTRAEALETLAEMDDPRALDAVIDIARNGTNRRTQLDALETLSDSPQQDRVIRELREIARVHGDPDIRRVAIEQLGDLENAEVIDLLLRIATDDVDLRVQRTAVEVLGSGHPHEAAIAALRSLIDDHPRIEVKLAAVEALGEFDTSQVVDLLANIARRHPDPRVQRRATETLADLRAK